MNLFALLIATAFLLVTLPIWGGAVLAIVTGGFYLAFAHPWLLLLIFASPFILRMFV